MGSALIAWNNFVLTSTLSAPSAALPVSNLKVEVGSASTAWQTDSGVTGAPGAVLTVTPPLTAQVWRAFGAFRTNLTSFASMTVSLYSGASTLIWQGQSNGPEPGYMQSLLVAPQDTVADRCVISFADVGNPDGFLNIPLVFAGPAWQPLTGPSYATTFGGDSSIGESTSRGGQEYPTPYWQRRRWEVAFDGIRSGEASGPLAELDLQSRRGTNVLFVPDIGSDDIAIQAIYGRFFATADIGYPYMAADRRSWRARITERI